MLGDDEEIDDLMRDGEAVLASMDETIARMERFTAGAIPADLSDDAPLTLEQARCLPELGGSYTISPGLRLPSETVTVKTLRLAIERGELRCGWLNTKNMYVTRRWVREWLECRDQGSPRTSSSVLPAVTARAASPTRPSGTSMTTGSSTSLDAARKIVQELRERSRPTSSGSTPKK